MLVRRSVQPARGGHGPDAAAVRRRSWHTVAVLALVVAASGCVPTGPGKDTTPQAEPITRPELLLALGEVAATFETAGDTLAGRQAVLNACIELPRLLERDTWNPKGILLRGDDTTRLQLARDKCDDAPRYSATLIRSVLYGTRPLDGVTEPSCKAEEIAVRFARHGLNSSGHVFLRIELVSSAKGLCAVEGLLSVQLVLADGQVLPADPRGSGSRYRTLPGPGTVQWFRLAYATSKVYCTGPLVPVKELRVRFPSDGGVRILPASMLPTLAHRYCTDGLLQLDEDADLDLDGP